MAASATQAAGQATDGLIGQLSDADGCLACETGEEAVMQRCRQGILFIVAARMLLLATPAFAQQKNSAKENADPLPSWNEGKAKAAILEFARSTTDKSSPKFVPPEERIAAFDQDGTLWVEQPIYTQVVFALDRV